MDKTFVEKIAELAAPNIIRSCGYEYSDKKLYPISSPQAGTLEFNTIRGMTEALNNESGIWVGPVIVNVRSHKSVEVYSALDESDRSREKPYVSTAELLDIPFGKWLDYESMMIALKSRFVETPELLQVVQLLGTITNEKSAQAIDDGFTQTVVVKKGIALKDNKVVKPIVTLKPYRTFAEVDQPESEFLIRLSENGTVALFEADGGAWKLQARSNIAHYIRANLHELIEEGKVIVTE